MSRLDDLIVRARAGDLDAFGRLVQQTQSMAYAVAKGVLRDAILAEDAAQEAYLRAFRRLRDLEDAASFAGWLRRIVITIALNMRRARRVTFLPLNDMLDVPVLDEDETTWTELQRLQLAGALLKLTAGERLLCDRRYHGRWTTARLARDAGVDETVIRKRLQRIRDKLRKEIEVAEQRGVHPEEIRSDFPGKIVELLARPRLTDLPENPVGRILELLRTVYVGFDEIELPEIIDFTDAMQHVGDALYVGQEELHRVDERRILRYDLTLPLLLTARYEGQPLRLWSAGKTYRLGRLDPWQITAQALHAVDVMLPSRGEDRADEVSDVQPGVGARGGRRRALGRGDGMGCLHGQDRQPSWRRSACAHCHRRRLRPRALRDGALRHRRHPQDRRQPRGVGIRVRGRRAEVTIEPGPS